MEKTLASGFYKTGFKEGREEGRGEGKLDAQYAMATKLILKGSSSEEVAELTELPLSDIQALSEKLFPPK